MGSMKVKENSATASVTFVKDNATGSVKFVQEKLMNSVWARNGIYQEQEKKKRHDRRIGGDRGEIC